MQLLHSIIFMLYATCARLEATHISEFSIVNNTFDTIFIPSVITNPKGHCANLPHNDLLIVIHSDPVNYKFRTFIRQTWGLGKRPIFVLGKCNNCTNGALQLEANTYGDILQGDFDDSYRNLTYKALTWLWWVNEYCLDKAPYILKTDDDVVVDVYRLTRHIKTYVQLQKIENSLILGWVNANVSVDREIDSKWFVTREEYQADYYPTYCSGSAYVISTNLVPGILNNLEYKPFFWIDDVYVTGDLTENLNVTFVQLQTLFLIELNEENSYLVYEFSLRQYLFGHIKSLAYRWIAWATCAIGN